MAGFTDGLVGSQQLSVFANLPTFQFPAFTLTGISQQRHTRLAAREEKYIDIATSHRKTSQHRTRIKTRQNEQLGALL
jgi:hypothetical protein